VHVVREDPNNRHLLFAGTDLGAYVSTDRGASWQRFMTGLPTVPVFDLKVHPRDRELIAGTHGRSIYVVDVAALEQMSDSLMRRPVVVFAPKPGYQYGVAQIQSWEGNKLFRAENPAFGTDIAYRVAGGTGGSRVASRVSPNAAAGPASPGPDGRREGDSGGSGDGATAGSRVATAETRDARRGTPPASRAAPNDSARIVITDVRGDTVRVLRGPAEPGVHRVTWDLRRMAPKLGPSALRDSVRTAARQRREADSTRRATANDTGEVARAVRALETGSDSARRQVAERYRNAPDSVRRELTRRVQILPDSARREVMAAVGPILRRGGGRGGDEPNRRPAEAPPGAGAQQEDNPFRGRRQGPLVDEGSYLVTVTVNGQTSRHVLPVERVTPVADVDLGGEEEEEEEQRRELEEAAREP
jgi:hypothetical protein